MITKISRYVAKRLCMYSNRQQEIEYVRYGLEIIIGGVWKWLCLMGVAFILGIVPAMLATLITFAIFRMATGGYHYSTYFRCFIAGLVSMTALSLVASKVMVQFSEQFLFISISIVFIVGLLIIYLYAPSNHFYKKSTKKHRKKLQQFAFFLLFVWVILIYNLVNMNTEIVWASVLGLLFQLSSTLPLSYKIVSKVENIIEWRTQNEKVS
ncbi:accessory gene regulator ArgB-like protein [Halalkalibacter hemicellulosilyticus]|uniref:Accessory gene regulator B n=1 Tax=Halalkalibacter hemicellulosilyticusJCM 9152 TaxID=1236971 RepID=W4QCG6_9BACI|nr:accessory gene regulator B family protein [Halalkalibacter hemicellulosilyticus]GAE29647.1 accessory gene regulator B [Halalkalibacter hemicellulosilyticusJCM 9152]